MSHKIILSSKFLFILYGKSPILILSYFFRITALEREISLQLFGHHSSFHAQHSHLQEALQKADHERSSEKTKSRQKISHIKMAVQNFRRELTNVRPTPEFVEKIKTVMEDIEMQISNFKEEQK